MDTSDDPVTTAVVVGAGIGIGALSLMSKPSKPKMPSAPGQAVETAEPLEQLSEREKRNKRLAASILTQKWDEPKLGKTSLLAGWG